MNEERLEVHLGTWTSKKTKVSKPAAIKLAKLDVLTKEQIKEIMREVNLSLLPKHPQPFSGSTHAIL